MRSPPPSATLFQCDSCGSLGLGQSEIVCCDNSMEPVSDGEFDLNQPSLDTLMRAVFDMSETELDICLCVMEGGEQTVAELAKVVGYHRSVVSRHLNHLSDLGVVDKRRRLLPEGGQVYVYAPKEPNGVRRSLTGVFVAWVTEATSLIDSVSREKIEAMVETDTDDPQWKIYQK